ncbi:N-acylneuraminate-9-phosphatase [Coccomyxa sp. Obi]|nr:N-acylneuraminate-9-phosphatase [Coccomyxa sp. Obi]
MGKPIKAVFFDMDDTLVLTGEADARAYSDVMKLATQLHEQVDAKKLIKAWRERFLKAPWDVNHKVDVDEWRTGLWLSALNSQGIEDAEMAKKLQKKFRTARLEHFILENGVKDMIQELRQQGLKAIIITNGHPEIQRGKLERLQAALLFDGILVGGEEIAAGGEEKPAASIFLKACQLAQCLPSEAVHIGDSLAADIQGGINAGLAATIWVNKSGHPLPAGAPVPFHIVSHVTQLPGVLKAICRSGSI